MRKQKYTILGTLLALSISGTSNASEVSCVVQPTCESLGYTQATSACVNSNYTACPFDTTKVKCHQTKSCKDLGYIYTSSNSPCEKTAKCPYDSAQLMCVSNPAVGDFKYSFKSSDHKGWWKADGRYVSSVVYASVYNLFGETFPSASKLSVLTPFIYAGVDYDAAYASYMNTIDTLMKQTIDPNDMYVDNNFGFYSYNDVPDVFFSSLDDNENEIIYENINGPDSVEDTGNKNQTNSLKMTADNYVDELSLNIFAYLDPDTNYLILGAHHDFTEVDLYGAKDSPYDVSSYFKLTASERYNLMNHGYTTLGAMYSKKCAEAAEALGFMFNYQTLDAKCNKGYATNCVSLRNSLWTPYALSDATSTIIGSNGYVILEPSVFMQRMSKAVHGIGISGLQEGLHYMSMDKSGNAQVWVWDGEGFITYDMYTRGKYGLTHPQYNSLLYPGMFPTSSGQTNKINFPDYHFYCVFDVY